LRAASTSYSTNAAGTAAAQADPAGQRTDAAQAGRETRWPPFGGSGCSAAARLADLRGRGALSSIFVARESVLDGSPSNVIPTRIAMREQVFHRVRRLPPYVFGEVNAMKAQARAAGRDIIDLGMGNPDQPTPAAIVEKLVEAARNPRAHRYSMSRGIPGLRRAQARYYARRFGVQLDPETEIVVTLGSKEGLANLAQAITAPGDVILAPNPS
jgi:hypothetical protein